MNTIDKIALLIIIVIPVYVIAMVIKNNNPDIEQVTPLHQLQQERVCYSPFDVYHVAEYTITEDNLTLITSHGRVYHLEDCRLAIGDTP